MPTAIFAEMLPPLRARGMKICARILESGYELDGFQWGAERASPPRVA
jgi:hypothetical protein